MTIYCNNGKHNYENNKVDSYICKDCGDVLAFDEVEEGKEQFFNLDI